MWFTRQADGFQATFALVRNGVLRTGVGSGNFTVTVVDPADSTSNSPTVTELTNKAGTYTFLIPSAFITTNGTGEYSVTVEANVASPPKMDAAFSEILKVSSEDLSTLAGSVWEELHSAHTTAGSMGLSMAQQNYEGAIHIDITNGSAGTTVGVNGTIGNPVNSLADAVTLAAATGIRHYDLRGAITLTSAHDDWVFDGKGGEATVNFNNQDVADSEFYGCTISGTIGNGSIVTRNCQFDGVTNFVGIAFDCQFDGSTELAVGTTDVINGASRVPGTSTPIFDAVGAGRSLNLRAYSGGVDLRNFTDGTNTASLEFIAGQAILGATNIGGTIVVRGISKVTDTTAGATVINEALPWSVWEEVQTNHVTAGSIGEAITDIDTNVLSILGTIGAGTSFLTIAGSTAAEVRTDATQADGFWDGMVISVTYSGAGGETIYRSVNSYSNTNGAFTLNQDLPQVPSVNDPIQIVNSNEFVQRLLTLAKFLGLK